MQGIGLAERNQRYRTPLAIADHKCARQMLGLGTSFQMRQNCFEGIASGLDTFCGWVVGDLSLFLEWRLGMKFTNALDRRDPAKGAARTLPVSEVLPFVQPLVNIGSS